MSDFYIKNEFYNSCIDKYFGSNIKYWDLCRKYLGKHYIFVEEDYCKMLGLPIAISDCTNEEIELKIKTIRVDINKRLKVARVISFTLIAILVFLFLNYQNLPKIHLYTNYDQLGRSLSRHSRRQS